MKRWPPAAGVKLNPLYARSSSLMAEGPAHESNGAPRAETSIEPLLPLWCFTPRWHVVNTVLDAQENDWTIVVQSWGEGSPLVQAGRVDLFHEASFQQKVHNAPGICLR